MAAAVMPAPAEARWGRGRQGESAGRWAGGGGGPPRPAAAAAPPPRRTGAAPPCARARRRRGGPRGKMAARGRAGPRGMTGPGAPGGAGAPREGGRDPRAWRRGGFGPSAGAPWGNPGLRAGTPAAAGCGGQRAACCGPDGGGLRPQVDPRRPRQGGHGG